MRLLPSISGIERECQFRRVRLVSAMNGNARNDGDATSLGADILNPFVHRLELGSTYEKLKVSTSLSKERLTCGIDARAGAF